MSAQNLILNVLERSEMGTGPSRRGRRNGQIPAVVYGHGGQARALSLSKEEWKLFSRKGDVHLVELKSADGTVINALIKDVQNDYLRGNTLHIDFQEVRMDEVITSVVSVHGRGVPEGTAQGGVLEQVIHEIEIECLPAQIPPFIEVDISKLKLNDVIHVGDMQMPEGVKVTTSASQVVFHVIELRIEVEPVASAEGVPGAEGATPAEPEVVSGKGKKEEPEEEEGTGAKEKEKKK